MATTSEALAIAAQHLSAGRYQHAEQLCLEILAENANQADAWHLLGVLNFQIGQYEVAIERISRAIAFRESEAAFHTSLGSVFQARRDLDAAISCFRRALELKPDHAETYNNLGTALHDQDKLDEAAASYRRALKNKPGLAAAHNNLGNVLQAQKKHAEAVECYQRALELNPSDAQACSNLANAFRQLERFDDAFASYGRALELQHDYPAAHCGRAMLRLLLGDFENGWPEYEWRWKTRQAFRRDFSTPKWQGEPLGAATILLYDEQGFGDTFQFVRYASLVKTNHPGATVILECQRPLAKVLQSCRGIDGIIARGDPLPAFNYHAPLLTIPAILQTTIDSIPAAVPYLSADPSLIAHWRERLARLAGLRVGINWHGRPGTQDFSRRNLPLADFAPLAEIHGVNLISLQIGEGREQLRDSLKHDLTIVDLGNDFDTMHGPFMDTAAVMMNLDLVITSDTSIPHLSGALGVPVWLALPSSSDWRWLLNRQDSPWYPTMRLFRQNVAGDWSDVVRKIADELRNLFAKSN